MRLDTIHHIAILCSDYRTAKAFYAEKLGFPVIRENYRADRNDWKIDLKINDQTELELFAVPDRPKRVTDPEAYGLRHLAFHVADVEAAVKELADRGVACEPVRADTFTGGKMTFFKDPDGLPIEIHE